VASYRVLFKPSAAKEFEALPRTDRRRIATKILSLAENPRPPGHEKLSGSEAYRIRQGDYRVIYLIQDQELLVFVMKVGHRREVYREP
jgi:mRNA interferase RelE/StbE